MLGLSRAQVAIAAMAIWSLSGCAPYIYQARCFHISSDIELNQAQVDKRFDVAAELASRWLDIDDLCATDGVHVNALSAWESYPGSGYVAGEYGPVRGMIVGADGAALLHEMFHAWEWRVLKNHDTGDHPGWIERGLVDADMRFQERATEWRAQ